MRAAWLYLTPCAFLLAAPALAETEIYAETGGWTISRHEDGCSLFMEFAGPGATTLMLSKNVDGSVGTAVSNYAWSAKEGETYAISYALNGRLWEDDRAVGFRSKYAGGFISHFQPGFERDFAAGTTLHILLDGKEIDRLSLSDTGNAVTLVNRCLIGVRRKLAAEQAERKRYADLPPDPFAKPVILPPPPPRRINALATPKGNRSVWVTTNDYPTRALREKKSGNVAVRLTIARDGRISACTVTSSSGSPDLDAATCTQLTQRARFDPATDGEGNPTIGSWETVIRWSIPTGP